MFFTSSCCSLLVVPFTLFPRERGFTTTAVLLVSLRERSLDTERKKGSISHTKLQTPSVKMATRLAANALPVSVDERGEIYTAVLLASIDVADYRVAWNATQNVIGHQEAKNSNVRITK
jgi:hypothetical protein